MKVSSYWLNNKINELNEWLQFNSETHLHYAEKKQNRDYYVSKLIELEENELKNIKV